MKDIEFYITDINTLTVDNRHFGEDEKQHIAFAKNDCLMERFSDV